MGYPIKLWIDIIQFLATGAIGVYVWFGNRERFEQRERLSRIEDTLNHSPSHADISGIYKRLDDLHGDLRELVGKVDALAKSHALVMQQMIEGRR